MLLFPKVILKQQRVIKRLLKKCYGKDFNESLPNKTETSDQAAPSSGAHSAISGGTTRNDADDSDSAIMLEDHLTEVQHYRHLYRIIHSGLDSFLSVCAVGV